MIARAAPPHPLDAWHFACQATFQDMPVALESVPQNRPVRVRKTLLYLHVRRELVEANEPLDVVIEDLNRIVRARSAIVLADGQFLTRPLSPDWEIAKYFDDETSTPYDHPPRPWTVAQRDYFERLWETGILINTLKILTPTISSA